MMILPLLACLLVPNFVEDPFPLGPYDGQCVAVSPDPGDPDVVLMLDKDRRLLRSSNGGLNWNTVGVNLPQGNARAFARVPGSPAHLYLVIGSRVFSSVNGGVNWTLKNAAFNVGVEEFSASSDGQTLLVLENSNSLWRSADGGVTFSEYSDTTMFDVAFAPSDSQRAYYSRYTSSTGGLWRSDDAGQSWSQVISGFPGLDMAVDPTDPDRLLLNMLTGPEGQGVYLSEDAGATIALVFGGPASRVAFSPDGQRAVVLHESASARWAVSVDGGSSFGPLGAQLFGVGDPTDLAMTLGGAALTTFSPTSQQAGGLVTIQPGGLPRLVGLNTGSVSVVLSIPGTGLVAGGLEHGNILKLSGPGIPGLTMGTGNTITPLALAARGDGRWLVAGTFLGEARIRQYVDEDLVVSNDLGLGSVSTLLVTPSDPDTVFAVSAAGSTTAAWRSSLHPLGHITWAPVAGLAAAPPGGVLALDLSTPGRVLYEDSAHRPWWSDDGGNGFTMEPTAWPGFGPTEWVHFDPFTPGHIIRDVLVTSPAESFDGGQTWTPFSEAPGIFHAQAWFDPVGRGLGLMIGGGDLYLTEDAFTSVSPVQMTDDLLANSDLQAFDVDATNGRLTLGTHDAGFWSLDGFWPHHDLGGDTVGTDAARPRHFGIGLPEIGTSWGLGVDRTLGGAAGVILVGTDAIDVPLWGGTFTVGGPIAFELPFVASGAPGVGGDGAFELTATLPSDPNLIGLSIVSQALLLDPGAAVFPDRVLSNGLRTTFR